MAEADSAMSTYFFENTMREPNCRPTPFEKLPNSSLARLFWKSRGLKWLVTLKILSPSSTLYLSNLPGRLTDFITCMSSEANVGKRPARSRGPTKLRSSSMIENGNPLRISNTGDSVIPYFAWYSPQKRKRFGASQGRSDRSLGRMIWVLEIAEVGIEIV